MKSNRILSTLFSILLATSAAVAGNPAADNTKASKIIIPKVEFRQATVDEGLAYLRVMSRKLDPDKSGVTIILVASEKTKAVKIDLDLVNVSLIDAVKSRDSGRAEMTRDGEAIVLKSK